MVILMVQINTISEPTLRGLLLGLANRLAQLQGHEGKRAGDDYDGQHGEGVPEVLAGLRLRVAFRHHVAQEHSGDQPPK